jgi:hypothetical protein
MASRGPMPRGLTLLSYVAIAYQAKMTSFQKRQMYINKFNKDTLNLICIHCKKIVQKFLPEIAIINDYFQ